MPQFSLKQLLITTALIAVGVAWIAYAVQLGDRPSPLGTALTIAMWFASCVCIGVGIFSLLKKPRVGALVGVLAFLAVWAYAIATTDI